MVRQLFKGAVQICDNGFVVVIQLGLIAQHGIDLVAFAALIGMNRSELIIGKIAYLSGGNA